jgi:hypothetical protein
MMRKLYFALSVLMLAATVLQFYFAAIGAFDKPQDDKSFAIHDANGMMVIPLLSILATIVAAIARVPGRLIAFTIVPLGLVILQVLIIVVGHALNDSADNTTPVGLAILGLHAINGLAVGAVAGRVFAGARKVAFAPAS